MLAGAAGCSLETTLALLVENDSGTTPTLLRLTEYGAGHTGQQLLSLGGHQLPGTLVLRGLDAGTPDFRILVDGLDDAEGIVAQAAVRSRLALAARSSATARLQAGPLPDGDGDGVPDVIDDCPGADDNLPTCSPVMIGSGGDGWLDPDFAAAPGSASDLATTGPSDLSRPPPSDLSRPPSDLSKPPPPPDMVHVLCPPGAAFCEGWENGYAAPWGALQTPGLSSADSIVADTTHAHTGSMSSHTTVPIGLQGLKYRTAPFTAITTGSIALRAYVWFGATPTAGWSYLYLSSSADNIGYTLGVTLTGGTPYWDAEFIASGTTHNYAGTLAIQGGRWTCLEFTYDLASKKGALYVDGQPASSFTETGGGLRGVPSAFDRVAIGSLILTQTAVEAFVDDLAIGTQRFNDCF